MKIRIKSLPKKMSGGPSNNYGGQSSAYGLETNNYVQFDPTMSYHNPFTLKDTLQPVPRETAMLEAERGEQVLADFDGDGQNEKMEVGGNRHSEGGTPLNLPNNSFIFSDTAKMRIKDPEVLQMFGKTKPMTPADIAKQYDINQQKAILDDPHTDNLQKKTAQLMIDNYQKKLGQLAFVQEAKKGFPQSIPDVAKQAFQPQQNNQPFMRFGGLLKAQDGLNNAFAYSGIPIRVPEDNTTNNPIVPYSPDYNPSSTPTPGSIAEQVNNNSNIPFGYRNQDKAAMALAAEQLATIKKYPAYIAPMRSVLPQTTFYSPEREIAANAEQANTQSMISAFSQDGARQRSNSSSIQGQALSNLAGIESRAQQQNVETSNRANQINADIMNKQLAYNADRMSKLYEQGVISDQQYQNSLRQGQSALLRTYEQSADNRQKIDLLNRMNISSGHYIDPSTGRVIFNPNFNGVPQGQGSGEDAGAAIRSKADEIKRSNPTISDETAQKMAFDLIRQDRMRTTTSPMNIGATRYMNTSNPYAQSNSNFSGMDYMYPGMGY
jgi:hypothetical protein